MRVFMLLAACLPLAAQSPAHVTAIRCGRLIDGKSAAARSNVVILVEGDRIRAVGANVAVPPGAEVIDLSHSTVLPGLIDNHTHIMLNGDITHVSHYY